MSKITYGLKKLMYAKKTVGEDGAITYAEPVAIPGAYEINLPASGGTTKVYGDDITYVKMTANQGYEGSFTCYELPESFLADILGQAKNDDGVVVEKADAIASEFALMGEFSTEEAKTKRWVLYNCSASRADFASKTKEENPEANQISVPITATPQENTELVKATVVGDSANEVWKNWFDSVYTPATEGGAV